MGIITLCSLRIFAQPERVGGVAGSQLQVQSSTASSCHGIACAARCTGDEGEVNRFPGDAFLGLSARKADHTQPSRQGEYMSKLLTTLIAAVFAVTTTSAFAQAPAPQG